MTGTIILRRLISLTPFCKGWSCPGRPVVPHRGCMVASSQDHWGGTLRSSLLFGVFGSHPKGLDQDGPQERLGRCPPSLSLPLEFPQNRERTWRPVVVDHPSGMMRIWVCLCRQRERVCSGLPGAKSPAGPLETSTKRRPGGPGCGSRVWVFFDPFSFSV